MGGGQIFLGTRPWTKEMTKARFDALAAILRVQPYVESVERWDDPTPKDITVDFSHFRRVWNNSQTLVGMQAVHAGFKPEEVSTEPWLTFPTIPKHNRIVLARSIRNQGLLQWFRFWSAHHSQCDFIGIKEDYDIFCYNNNPWYNQPNRQKIPHKQTADLLEAAQWIEAGRLLVTNQTSILWLGWGMGKSPMIIECTTEDSTLTDRKGITYIRRVEDNLSLREVMAL